MRHTSALQAQCNKAFLATQLQRSSQLHRSSADAVGVSPVPCTCVSGLDDSCAAGVRQQAGRGPLCQWCCSQRVHDTRTDC